MKDIYVAKVVIENDNGDVLVLRRSATDSHRAGDWDFPGGRAEPGESPQETGVRETEEEAGILIENPIILYQNTEYYEPEDENVHRTLLYARKDGDVTVTLSFEHDMAKWVPRAEAPQVFPHRVYGAGLQYALDKGII